MLVLLVFLVAGGASVQGDKISAQDVPELEKEKHGEVSEFGPAVEQKQLTLDEDTVIGEMAEEGYADYESIIDTSAVEARTIPTETLDRFRNDPDYQYEEVATGGPSMWESFMRWLNRTFFEPIAENTSRSFWFWFWIISATIIIGWVISRMLTSDSGGFFRRQDQESKPPEIVLLDTENIEEVDLKALLNQALANGHHRDSARYMYLLALQSLTNQGVIDWHKYKTNREYLREVRKNGFPDLAGAFSEVTHLFEWIWYGEAPVDESMFPFVQTRFDAFQSKLNTSSSRAGR